MGNTIGHIFRITTFGESHGEALGCVIDGCPPKLPLTEEDIQRELDRRKPGQSELTTPRKETDKVKILSGVFEGKTLGTPIAMVVFNVNQNIKDYSELKDVFRPGHADYVWEMKYGFRDYRGGGRSSGRETVSRVMAGAVAKKLLALKKIKLFVYAAQIGKIVGQKVDFDFIEKNLVRAADPAKAKEMETCILNAKQDGDSVGGIVEVVIKNAPVGLGEPVFDKLNADLAKAILSIPAMKALEFGSGFSAAEKTGFEQNDPFIMKHNKIIASKNDSGGISGGISNGSDIVMRIAVKAPSSILKEQMTVTNKGSAKKLQVKGRHDPCIVPRVIPVIEAMTAITIADHLLMQQTNFLNH